MSAFRNWMYENRRGVGGMMTVEFVNGVNDFLNFAFSSAGHDTQISCLCKECKNWREQDRDTITEHLYKRGFVSDYRIWSYHGESFENYGCNYKETSSLPEVDANLFSHRDMVEDAFPQFLNNDNMQWEEPNGEAKAFYDLLSKADKPVYEAHEKSLLQWVTEIMNFKTTFNPSQAGMDYFIRSCRAMAPSALREQIPDSYAQVKNIMSKLGLGVIKYDVCVNDCFLYYKEGESLRSCPICQESRYKPKTNEQGKDIAHKKLWYFPIVRRLQRLFMSRKTAEHMTWHKKCEPESDRIVHPAGAKAWKHFDRNYPAYAAEPRNIRLGISTDGFNPFNGTGAQYSCWPIFVTPYNLPPDLCMNQEFIFLSLLISGPTSPRVNIDVMLRPLVDDLKILWVDGVFTWDCVQQENFVMRANVLWTISDFPAYGMLSGWSTHGRLACPYCMEETESFRLQNGGKPSWFDCHRCFLPQNHPHRKDRRNFYAGQEVNEKRREHRNPDEMKEIVDSLPQVTFGIHYTRFQDLAIHITGLKKAYGMSSRTGPHFLFVIIWM